MDTTLPRIVVAETFRPDVLQRLRQHAQVVELKDATPESLIAAVSDADGLLVRMRAAVTARIIDAAPRLRVIARAGGSLEHIDMREAARRNIMVLHTPDVAGVSTAEFAVGMILVATRRMVWYDRRVREHNLEALRSPGGRELRNLTVGLLGSGCVADAVARILGDGFHTKLVAHSPDPAGHTPPGVPTVTLPELLRDSDVLAVHLTGGERFIGLIGQAELAAMRPTSYVISTSRAVVDSRALADALKTHRLAGAALDSFDPEELTKEHPLLNAPNCLLTPRVAGSSLDVAESQAQVAEDLIRVLRGEPPHMAIAGQPPR